ncbi:MAG: filamentous hemagglutinin N-terminal domain-containing protein, partial [Campylobacteraceae bacterium]|nr:filamentous hemagglutinin N-terminal domain-containing protein [Campylobacteraceae bacterium]
MSKFNAKQFSFTTNFKRFISSFVAFALVSNPFIFASDIIVDDSFASHAPSIEMSPSGNIPIINIVKPNEQGLSHNKFKDYNVNKEGVILNNSNEVVNTKLAGHIMNNPNLGKEEGADVILNEVTGTKKSNILGYMEVAGKKADVIVANPNGIYVNGGGFINVNAATLTTGELKFKDGLLNGFDVNGGNIVIDGFGFNANNIDRVNLYANALTINSKLYANTLNVILGSNDINSDGSYISKDKTSTGISLDSSALGGIYANTIFLTSSDKGVGVNLPLEILAADTLTLNANGDIVVNTIAADNKIFLASSNDITVNNDKSISANSIDIKANNLYNNGEINALNAKGTSNINIVNNLINNALIGGYDLNLFANTITNSNDSALYAKNNLKINSNTLTNEELGYIRSDNNAYFNIKDTLYNKGDIYSKGNIHIGSLEQRAGNITNHSDMKIEADMTNYNGATIEANGNITVFANELNNIADAPVYDTNVTHKSWMEHPRSKWEYRYTQTTSTEYLKEANLPSKILSDGSINIDVNKLTNVYSLIAANDDIVINANEVKNMGKVAVTTVNTHMKAYEYARCPKYRSHKWCDKWSMSYAPNVTREAALNYGIQAINSVTINADTLTNGNYHIDDPLKEEEIKANQEKLKALEDKAFEYSDTAVFFTDLKNGINNPDEEGYLLFEIEDFFTYDENTNFDEYKEQILNIRDGYKELLDDNLQALQSIETALEKLKALDEYKTKSIEIQTILENKLDALKENINLANSELNKFQEIYDGFDKENIDAHITDILLANGEVKSLVSQNIDSLDSGNFFDLVESLQEQLSTDMHELGAKINQDIAQYGSIEDEIITEDEGLYKVGIANPVDDSASPSFKEVTINGITIPTGKYGEFIAGQNQNYLIESNPLYADFGKFIGSGYLQDRLGFNQEETFKRLGDGMYETKLIRDAIIKQTGNRYLEGYYSDTEQFQALMDNAISVHEDLKLTYGVALTYEQISNLNKDIVWMEEKEIWGQKVLVPVLYLASTNINNYGPKITAKGDINLNIADDFTNKGYISSGNNLNIQANTLTNTQGVIASNNDMNIYTKTSLLNQGGAFISGNNMNIVSDGTITSESLSDKLIYGYYKTPKTFGIVKAEPVFVTTQTDTIIGTSGLFISGGNTNILANDNINLLNTNVIADNNINIVSNKDVTIGSQEEKDEYDFKFKGGFSRGLDVTNHGSNILGSNINIGANNILIDTSNLNANDLLYLNAKENIDILSRNDVTYRDFQSTQKGFMSKTTTRDMSYHEDTISSTLSADNILISSGKTTTLEAAKLTANENIYVDAKENINVVAKLKKDANLHMQSKSSWGGLKKSLDLKESEAFTLSSSDIETIAENIVFKSGDDINIIASNINSASDLQLEAFDNVLIAAGIEKSA